MTWQRLKKFVLILMAVLFLGFILSIGLFIRLQSVAAVKQIVSTLSNDQYAFDATSIRVDPIHLLVKVKGLRVGPTHPGDKNNEFELRADAITLKISEVFRLIFQKQLRVDECTLVNPALTMKVYEKDSTRRQKEVVPLHHQVAKMQEIFFKVLQSLQVQKFQLINGAVAFYPDFNANRSRYFLNHINLSIKDLHLVKRIEEWDNKNRVAIRFELLHPTINYPDSTIVVQLESMLWDSRERKFDMNGLGFHKQLLEKGDSSGFRLEGIELDSLNWNRLLMEGKVELGALKASRGYFSSNDFNLKRNRDSSVDKPKSNLLEVIGPILIRNLTISEIDFTGNTHTRRGKESLSINGEHFFVKNLVIDKNLPHKVELDELQLKVKAFLESDSNRTFQSGFNELSISKNNLVLKDYFLHSLRPSSFGENKIDVRELSLVGLSINDLINGKLKARALVLTDPVIRVVLAKGKAKKSDFNWQQIRRQLSKKMEIGILRINNAKAYVNQAGRKTPYVSTDSFYAVISSSSLLRSRSLEELFGGENSISMPRLAIRHPNLWVDCRNATYINQDFTADAAVGGTTDGNMRFKLRNVRANDINTAGIIEGSDSTLLRVLEIGSGDFYLRLKDNPNKKNGEPSRDSRFVRTIHSGKVQLHIEGRGMDIRSIADTLVLEKLHRINGQWTWDSLLLAGRNLRFTKPRLRGTAGQFLLSNFRESQIRNAQWELDTDQLTANLQLPDVQFRTGINNTQQILEAFREVNLKHPGINLLLKNSGGGHSAAKNNKPIELPVFRLTDPVITIRKEDSSGITKLAALEDGQITINTISLQGKRISTKGLSLDLRKIATHRDKFDLQIPELELVTGPIAIDAREPIHTVLEKLRVTGGRFNMQNENKKIALNQLNIRLEKSFRINTSPDSLKKLLSSLPHLHLTAAELLYEKADRTLDMHGLKVESTDKEIAFDSLSWTSNLSRDSFFKAAGVQKDFIQMRTGAGKLSGYEMIRLDNDTAWKISRLELDRLNLLVERDKRFPTDSVRFRPLLSGSLLHIPLPVAVNRIDLTHGNIRYNEISEKNGREGHIFFSDLQGSVRQVRNYGIQPEDSLRINVRSKLMGRGDLRVSFAESYTDSLRGFYLFATMGRMNFDALSPLLLPMFNLRINRGFVDTLTLRVKANDYIAFGNMQMQYQHLNFSLLREDGKKRGFLSRVANTFVRTNNQKTGRIFRERLRNKSTFNYWGKIALSGLLTNMGVQRNKKMDKKYRREMSNLHLPETLLQE
ncbi:hypothetical protein [Flavihumibacter petaseus]|uniref:Uncharacterized protein n=1 Tax=Flavihumibacter petaseus NBRC 106054 TaxID=1220578 RepID=A0A0E9N5I8_9BACT|nr:hypothetical protein [Flavihumibacter petaseus]GAO44946.1 hypothetical protein FPE01S_04_01890 [Flavihumibacter petaseus NBRC 106054]